MRLCLREADRHLQLLDGLDVDGAPIIVPALATRVLVGGLRDARDADDLLAVGRVVVEAEVALLHRPQVVARLVVPHAVPDRAAVADEIVEGVYRRLALDEERR